MTLQSGRRARLRTAMQSAGFDALVTYGNAWHAEYLRYVTDFTILEGHGVAVLGADDSCLLYLDSATDVERARAETERLDIRFSTHVASDVAAALESRRGQSVAAAPRARIPFGLVAASPVDLADATPLLETCFLHKLPAEVDRVRTAARFADEAYVAFCAAARAGRKQFELAAEVESWLRAHGVADNFMLLGSGGTDIRSVAPPSSRELATGDLVITELTPAVEGYFAQLCRTLVIGPASDAQKRAYDIYIEALEAGIAAVAPGALASDVARAENDVFRKYGLGEYITSAYTRVRGHGIGLFPDAAPHILEDVDTELRPGMTFVVHPNTYNPDVGYMMLGDSVTVTETGVDVLTKTPRVLFSGAG